MSSFAMIQGNLTRQWKAFELLISLLEEEFSLLREGKTDDVVTLEFSIHELLRQLAVERAEVRKIMQNTRLTEYADLLEQEQAECIHDLVAKIDLAERKSTKQARFNTQISLALLDQSQDLLNFLRKKVSEKPVSGYGAKGAYKSARAQAALLIGRA